MEGNPSPVTEEVETYYQKEGDFIKQLVILGVSRYSDSELIVKAMDVLDQMLQRGNDELTVFVEMMRNISVRGLGVNQSSLLLCLAYCYQKNAFARVCVGEIIPALCRIPTQLFLFLKFLKEFSEHGTDGAYSAEFYKSLLRSLGSNAGSTNSKKRKKNLEEKGMNISTFIPKQKCIAKWYNYPKRSAQDLLLLLTKYPRRYDWDNKSLCKYSHFKFREDDPEREQKNIVLQYHLHGFGKIKEEFKKHQDDPKTPNEVLSRVFGYIDVFEQAKKGDVGKIVELLKQWKRHSHDAYRSDTEILFTFNTLPTSSTTTHVKSLDIPEGKFSRLHLTIEHLPTKMYNEKEVWEELIQDMPLTAMLKHVSHMTHLGLFELQENLEIFQNAFSNEQRLYPFTHPLNILKALLSYNHGSSCYNKKKWIVNTGICRILNEAYLVTSKRMKTVHFDNCFICVDISGPMREDGFTGFDRLSAAMASVAVATAIEKLGKCNSIFICGNELKILKNESLMDRLGEIKTYDDNTSNLSLPIQEALVNKKLVDGFIIFTMSTKESICGLSPYKAFKQYRDEVNSNVKLVICSMGINTCVIADPDDSNVITLCGADADLLPEIYVGIYPDGK